MDTLNHLFASPDFMPHGRDFLWTPLLLWIYGLSDAVMALAYYSIPIALWYYLRRRPDLPFRAMFMLFAVFIFAGGTMHVLAVWTLWQPVYWLDAALKAVAAAISLVAAIIFWPLIPRVLSLPGANQLAQANDALKREIVERTGAEGRLQELNQQLGDRVAARTAELEASNAELRLNIAKRVQVEQSLRDNQELLQSVVNNATTAIYIKHLSGRYLLVNRCFENLFHVTQADVLERTDYDLFEKVQADAFRAVDEQVAISGEVVEAEEIAVLDDGPHTYISIKFPIRDGAGQIYAVGGISTDITARQHAEQVIRDNEEQTRLIVDTALDAVITIDNGGVITGWNPHAETTFGWSRDEALGRVLSETIIPARQREAHERGLRHYLATGEERVLHTRLELSALHRDGREFPVELAITPIRSGGRISFSAFIRDITDRKQREAHIQEALQEKNALLGEVHHRVKNNLQIVSSLLDLQASGSDDPHIRNLLMDSQNRIHSMGLIHQTLYESHNFAQVDFSQVLDSLVPNLMQAYGVVPERITIAIDAHEIFLPINTAIPCGLMVNELVSNIFKHAFPAGRAGTVAVALNREADDSFQLVVSDDGVGFPADLSLQDATTLGMHLVALLTDQIGGTLAIQPANPTQISIRFAIQK